MKAVEILVPPDKSISHRAIMLASISEGTSQIKNLLMAEDIKRTIDAFRAMGVTIKVTRSQSHKVISADVIVRGLGMKGFKKPSRPLYLGNSGTTMRLLPGILAGQDFEAVLEGDISLSRRPMKRIVEPLKQMGAEIASVTSRPRNDQFSVIASPEGAKQSHEIYPPLKIRGGKLKAIKYKSRIASAQVKSCILLAGLYADGVTSVTEPVKSRDHTERMLRMFGCRIYDETLKGKFHRDGTQPLSCKVSIVGPVELKTPGIIEIPGDISSAAFFIVTGCILPDTKIILKNVGLNPTRTGVLDILKRMGADIKVTKSQSHKVTSFEPKGDIVVKSSKLKGAKISPGEVVRAIDEIPIIMVAACVAKGKTVIRGIEELHVKETDRVYSMVTNLKKVGADIDLFFSTRFARSKNIVRARHQRCRVENSSDKQSCIIINGGKKLHGARVSSFGDHRTAMSMLIAGLMTRGRVTVRGLDCINKSFPGFERLLRRFAPRNDK